MPKILRKKPGLLPLINGVSFEPYGDYSISKDVGSDVAASFVEHDGYELVEEEKVPNPSQEEVKETASERKARLKAEREAANKPVDQIPPQETTETPDLNAGNDEQETPDGEEHEVF